ncbi:MAG: response regulator [Bacteroidota bacterium]|nr:response regulator [Bacteroidota bacterium]
MKKTQGPPKYKHVLLVDEDQIDNYINERIITSSNFADRVTVQNSGRGALNFLAGTEPGTEDFPQIIFLDLNMPIMDGFAFLDEYAKLVEKNPAIERATKIIVLSSSISPQDIDRASANPFVFRYLNKPLTEKYLEAVNVRV